MNKGKTTKNQVIKICIFLILLLQVNFFDLLPTNTFIYYHVNSYSVKNVTLLIVVILLPLVLLYNGKTKGSFTFPLVILLMSVIYISYNSMVIYEQGILDTARISQYFFIVILYWELRHEILQKETFKYFLKISIAMGTINAAIQTINSFLVMHVGKNFLHQASNVDADNIFQKAKVILGFVRVQTPADFIYFSMVAFLAYQVFFKQKLVLWKSIFVYTILSFYIVFVGQTRVYELLFALISFALIVNKWKKQLKKWWVISIPVLTPVIIVGTMVVLQKLSFTSGERVASFNVRLEAINYYLNHFRDNGIFGIGFANDVTYFLLNHGYSQTFQKSAYYYDDVGVFGFLGKFGILGLFVLLSFIVACFGSFITSQEKLFSFVVIVSLGITSVSLVYLDPQRIVLLPLMLLLLSYASNYRRDTQN